MRTNTALQAGTTIRSRRQARWSRAPVPSSPGMGRGSGAGTRSRAGDAWRAVESSGAAAIGVHGIGVELVGVPSQEQLLQRRRPAGQAADPRGAEMSEHFVEMVRLHR